MRYLLGWGAGSVEIQIEGRIWEEGEERRLVAEFVLREWHSGYAQSGMNTQVLKPEYCLRYAAEEIILEFCLILPEHFPGTLFEPLQVTPIAIAKGGRPTRRPVAESPRPSQ